MRILRKILILLFFLYTAPSTADIVSLNLRADNRPTILFSEFEFTHAGYLSFAISLVSVTSTTSSQPDPSSIGFFLQSREVVNQHLSEFKQNSICMLDFKYVSRLFTFQDLSHHHHNPPHSVFNKSYNVTHPGENSLFFVNCEGGDSLVTIHGRVELYNMDDDGTTKNYLSAGVRHFPVLYFIASIIYLCFLAVWISVCFKNRRCFHKMHLIMGGLLVMIFLHFIFAAAAFEYVKATGTPHGFDVVFYIFGLIRNVHLFTVVVLIGAGWCFWRPFLARLDKLVLIIVIILQVWANVDYTLASETAGPYSEGYVDWTSGYILVDYICCLVVIGPMASSIKLLRETRDGNVAMNFAKLCVFAFAVIVYVAVTRSVFISGLITERVDYWLEETSLLAFCMVVFYMFRPFDEDKDRNSVEMAVRDVESLSTS